MRSLLAGILFSALLLLTAGPAQANDLSFQNWTETWVFHEDDDDDGGGFSIGGFSSFSTEYDLFPVDPSVIAEPVFDVEEFLGWNVDVTIPNFVDPLTTKAIKVVFDLGDDDDIDELPSVLSIVAYDTPAGGQESEILCPGPDCAQVWSEVRFQKEGDDDDDGSFFYYEIWELYPNPDWEIVSLFIPEELDIDAFHIFTRSFGEPVPEPGPLALVTLGLVGLGMAGRHRR